MGNKSSKSRYDDCSSNRAASSEYLTSQAPKPDINKLRKVQQQQTLKTPTVAGMNGPAQPLLKTATAQQPTSIQQVQTPPRLVALQSPKSFTGFKNSTAAQRNNVYEVPAPVTAFPPGVNCADAYSLDLYGDGPNETYGTGSTERIVMKAMYNFVPQNSSDLPFDIHDRILILSPDEIGWPRGRNLSKPGQPEGFVPRSYLVPDEDTPRSHDAWFDFTRAQAERALLMPGVRDGTYLIRPQTDEQNKETTVNVVLSVRHRTPDNRTHVRHFKIKHTESSDKPMWSIGKSLMFASFGNLISHYNTESIPNCSPLLQPYTRTFAPPNRLRDFEVNRDQVFMQERLGKGSFGEVYRALYCGCLPVAVKMLQEGRMSIDEFIKEARAMYRLSHKNVVQLLGVCTKIPPVYIITEIMEHGSLLDFMRKDAKVHPEPTLKGENLIDILAQVASGMEYLESLNYIHRDLRAANILLSADNTAKVADFGLAKLCEDSEVYQVEENAKFPVKWTAPEACLHRIYSTKSDVWSFGVLCIEVTTRGGSPFPGMSGSETINFVQNGGRMARPVGVLDYCPEYLYGEIMLKCWQKNPQDRPTFRYLNEAFSNFACTLEQQYVPTS